MFCLKRSFSSLIWLTKDLILRGCSTSLFRRQLTRPVRFEFESNEEEERAIAEAIAKEEEIMRLEEERRRTAMVISVETELTRFEDEMRRKEREC